MRMVKWIGFICSILWFVLFFWQMNESKEVDIMYKLSVSTNMWYKTIGTNVYGAQPDKDQLIDILKAGVKIVIRMNGDGKDSGGMSIEEEASICYKYGARLLFINAHMGYEKGRGYVKSGERVSDILNDGYVFLHCLHGFDRTGAMMAVYLRRFKGFSTKEIIISNRWETYLVDKSEGNYYKYYESLNY